MIDAVVTVTAEFVGIRGHIHTVRRHVVGRNIFLDEIHERLGRGSNGSSSRSRGGATEKVIGIGNLVANTTMPTTTATQTRWRTEKGGSRRLGAFQMNG